MEPDRLAEFVQFLNMLTMDEVLTIMNGPTGRRAHEFQAVLRSARAAKPNAVEQEIVVKHEVPAPGRDEDYQPSGLSGNATHSVDRFPLGGNPQGDADEGNILDFRVRKAIRQGQPISHASPVGSDPLRNQRVADANVLGDAITGNRKVARSARKGNNRASATTGNATQGFHRITSGSTRRGHAAQGNVAQSRRVGCGSASILGAVQANAMADAIAGSHEFNHPGHSYQSAHSFLPTLKTNVLDACIEVLTMLTLDQVIHITNGLTARRAVLFHAVLQSARTAQTTAVASMITGNNQVARSSSTAAQTQPSKENYEVERSLQNRTDGRLRDSSGSNIAHATRTKVHASPKVLPTASWSNLGTATVQVPLSRAPLPPGHGCDVTTGGNLADHLIEMPNCKQPLEITGPVATENFGVNRHTGFAQADYRSATLDAGVLIKREHSPDIFTDITIPKKRSRKNTITGGTEHPHSTHEAIVACAEPRKDTALPPAGEETLIEKSEQSDLVGLAVPDKTGGKADVGNDNGTARRAVLQRHIPLSGGHLVVQPHSRVANPDKPAIHYLMDLDDIFRLQDPLFFQGALSGDNDARLTEMARLTTQYFNVQQLRSIWEAIGWNSLPKPVSTSKLGIHMKHRAVVTVHRLYPDWPEHVLWEAVQRAARRYGR